MMGSHKSTGGWLSFRREDQPQVPGRKSDSIFTKDGLLVFAVMAVLQIAGGIVYSHFFGPHS